ncbi:MAG: GNAT family acetyltransferase [Oscillospiraceae bacterium]|nr:GNAT family acetyltransferase [Oscillospiraceae bacterium]MBQ9332240.1 GNAT family acetyltransferase [Oscillospiraceae bacterium]
MAIITENILDIIESGGETALLEDLSAFSSPANPEIEDFIHSKAVEFAKRKLSITYLLTDVEDGQLLGYFTLTHKAIDINGSMLSNSAKKKLLRHAHFDQDTGIYTASAFLLAQFGKNYAIDQGKRITGREMMEYAIDILADIQHRIGGGVVYLDAEDRPKLRAFYETEANFKLFGKRLSETDGIQYLQYMRLL